MSVCLADVYSISGWVYEDAMRFYSITIYAKVNKTNTV